MNALNCNYCGKKGRLEQLGSNLCEDCLNEWNEGYVHIVYNLMAEIGAQILSKMREINGPECLPTSQLVKSGRVYACYEVQELVRSTIRRRVGERKVASRLLKYEELNGKTLLDYKLDILENEFKRQIELDKSLRERVN